MTPLPTNWPCGLITHTAGMADGGCSVSSNLKYSIAMELITDMGPAEERSRDKPRADNLGIIGMPSR